MAELLHVIYNLKHAGGQTIPAPPGLGATTLGVGNGGDGFTEYSKEEVEKLAQTQGNEEPKRFGTEAMKFHGPIMEGKILTVTASSAANAAKFVKYIMGGEVLGVVAPWAGKTAQTEAPPTNKEQGEKPMDTIKTSALEITGAV